MNEFETELFSVFEYNPETGCISKNGEISTYQSPGRSRLKVSYKRKTFFAHRLAWFLSFGCWPVGEIDHINGVDSDNRLSNLRDVSKSINQQNKRRPRVDNKSGFLGVHFHKAGKAWVAQITHKGTAHYLGIYKTPEEAHEVYLQAKRSLHEGCTI
jgi:hypothetical protein